MSNRRRPTSPLPVDEEPAFEWLLCADCASTVEQVYYGTAPHLVLSIEVAHSLTCPAPKETIAASGNEIRLQFLPKSRDGADGFVLGSDDGSDDEDVVA